jgi:hypothetical protein
MKHHPLALGTAILWVPWAWVACEAVTFVVLTAWLWRVARRENTRKTPAHLAAAVSFH